MLQSTHTMASRKRAALLIGGRVLTLDKCIQSWVKNLFEANPGIDFEIVMSLNSKVEDRIVDTEAIINRTKDLSPANAHIGVYKICDYVRPDNARLSYNILSMFWHNKRAFDLLESTNWDYVIKWRADIVMTSQLELPIELEPNAVYLPIGKDWGGLNDQIAVGTREVMQIYCKLIDHIDELWPVRHPERLLKEYLCTFAPHMKIYRLRFRWDLHPDRYLCQNKREENESV